MKSRFFKKIICAAATVAMIIANISSASIQVVEGADSNGDYFKNSFEGSTDNWSGRGSASVDTNSKNYYDGSSSLYVSGRGSEWNGASIELDSSVFVVGETYSFSAAVLQTSGANVTIQMSLQHSGDNGTSYAHIADCTSKSGEWTKLENTEFTIPSNTGDMVLYIETPENSGDLCDLYIDTVQVSSSGKSSSVVTGQGKVGDTSEENQQQNNNNTIKIMPIGDSITFGIGETGGYRKYLDYFLEQKGYTKVDMVGPEGSNSASFNYKGKSVTYDDNHAGYSGFQIKQVPGWGQANNDGSLYNKLKSKNAVKQAQPDIILLIIGTNDMTANRSMSDCEADLHDLVDYMLSDLPSESIIFMGSIPEFTIYGGTPQKIANYNNTVKKVAEDFAKSSKNVKFADVHGCLNGAADLTSDNLHPNGTGYEKMGKFWAGVIDEYTIASQPVVTTTTTTTTTSITTTTTTTIETTATTSPSIVYGDLSGDGKVTNVDLVTISQYLIGDIDLSGAKLQSADVTNDGRVDVADLALIKQYIMGDYVVLGKR